MSGVIQQFPVEREYQKNPSISSEDIKKLRDWMKTQTHLPEQYWTDLDLIIAYHCCECSTEVTKQVIDLHISTRTLFKEIFQNRVIDKRIIDTLQIGLFTALPTPTVHGYRAMYCRLLDGDYRKYNLSDMLRTFMAVFDLWQYEEGTWPGFVLILDMKLTTLNHLSRLDIMAVKQTLYFLQECMLVKLKEVHFTNAPYFMDKVMNILKPFMKNDLIQNIQIHKRDSEDLYKFVHKESLPRECGGNYKDLNTLKDYEIRRLQDNKEFFVRENLRRVNESLRQNGKTKTVEDVFGIQGNFKKLDID
ncbi:unnamed protein product [Danaus chrysippus]|uniref:(African queen) hypothetical protein n=1 Tax=Danaus chrysippus TaxID=151541 RepID=A0A8J2VQ01_9NEOP|nr:unnamed protein product [Danaus chrysippus]